MYRKSKGEKNHNAVHDAFSGIGTRDKGHGVYGKYKGDSKKWDDIPIE